MYKYLSMFIALFAMMHVVNAQTKETITGNIITSDGYPAEHISVMIEGTPYGTVTDQNGNFSFEAPTGEYKLIVYSFRCHRREIQITVHTNKINHYADITIIENKNQLNEIVVTGQFKPQSLRNSVYRVRVIGTPQIQSKGATNIQSLLNTEVGIRLSNDMALGETDFELMGMSGNNIKVLIDGIPVIDRLTKKQSLSQIDINTIERVEIVEGPMSVIYGSDALAGVINIITKKHEHDQRKAWKIGARIQEETIGNEYDFASGKGVHNQNVSAAYTFANGLFANGSFTRNQSGGWQGTYTGRKKQWQPKDQYIAGGQFGYNRKDFNAWYRLDYLSENLLTEANINELTNKTSDKEFIVDRYTHQLQSEWKASNAFRLSGAASFQNYSRRTRTTNIDLNTGKRTLSLDQGAQDETSFSSLFGRLTGLWSIANKLSLQPGIEYQSTTGIGDRINGEQHIENTAIFLSVEYTPFSWLNMRPGLRSNFNSVFEAPKAVPSLNTKFGLNEHMDLRLSYGRGYRAPTLQELFYSFHDANHNINGNPDLAAEYSNSYMASFVWRLLHDDKIRLTSTLSGFYNDFKNRISLIESFETPGYYWYYNIDSYKTTGFTLENALSWKGLRAHVNFSYVGRYNRYYEEPDLEEAEMTEFRFSPELSTNVSYDWPKVAIFSLFYKYTGKRHEYMVDSNKEVLLRGLNSYHWGDISVSRKINDYLTVNIGSRNLFNITEVRSTASGSSGGHGTTSGSSHLGSGRSFFAGVLLNL